MQVMSKGIGKLIKKTSVARREEGGGAGDCSHVFWHHFPARNQHVKVRLKHPV